MALTPADPTKWGLPAGAAEVVSQRGRDHKIFAVAPGQFVAKFRHYIHYQLGDGTWDDADLSFQPSGSDQVVTKNHLLHAAVRASGGLEVTTPAGVGVRWLTPQTPITSGNRASYSDGTLSWTYEVGPRQVKHSATVAAKRGPQSYQFTYLLLGGAADFTLDSGGNLVSGSGFSVPRASILGADGSSYQAGPWQVLAGPRVAFSWDDSALPASAYPYVIDPTTTFSEAASADDIDISNSGSSYSLLSSGTAALGPSATVFVRNGKTLVSSTYSVGVSFYKFDTSTLTSGATISGATLDLTEYDTSLPATYTFANTDSRNLVGEYYATSNWPITTSAWTKTVGTTAFSTGLGTFTGTTGNAVSLTLSSPDANISKTSTTGFRLGVDGGQPTGKNNVCVASFDNTTSAYRPTLTVTYSTNPAITGTGGGTSAGSGGTLRTNLALAGSGTGSGSGSAGALTTHIPLNGTGGGDSSGSTGSLGVSLNGTGGGDSRGSGGTLATNLHLAGSGGGNAAGSSGLLTLLLSLSGSGGGSAAGSSGSLTGHMTGSGGGDSTGSSGTLSILAAALIQLSASAVYPGPRLTLACWPYPLTTSAAYPGPLATPASWPYPILTGAAWPRLTTTGAAMVVNAVWAGTTGDDIDISVPVALSNLTLGTSITDAWLEIKVSDSQLDAAALITKHITTTNVAGTGQISDNGATSQTAQLTFSLTETDTGSTLAANVAYAAGVKVKTSTGKEATIIRGTLTLAQAVVRTS